MGYPYQNLHIQITLSVAVYGWKTLADVKVGDKVSRGQVIAYVGTSGYTTGAHLNLNIYKDSVAVDPMGYFK